MRGVYWKVGAAVMVGAVAGLFGGQATVAGMTSPPPRTLAERPFAPADDGYGPAYTMRGTADPSRLQVDDARIVAACDDCSDYDLGYRFAAARQIRESGECLEFSWSYQRGCLAWLRQE